MFEHVGLWLFIVTGTTESETAWKGPGLNVSVSWPNRQEAEPIGTLLMLLYRDRSGLKEDRGPTGAYYNCHQKETVASVYRLEMGSSGLSLQSAGLYMHTPTPRTQ